MKVVLFCGGLGLRLQEAGWRVPKPLIPVGHEPILIHLMRYYAHFGHTEFILCLGHNARAFEDYFRARAAGDWDITFADTGATSTIGERLRRVRDRLDGDEYFLANYGDVLSDAPLDRRIERLKTAGKVASLLSVKPTYTAHTLELGHDGTVTGVAPMDDGSMWINGGYLIFRRDIFDYLEEGEELVEQPFRRLIDARQLIADHHEGFWAPMDTLKEKNRLDVLAETAVPPWAVWLRDGKVVL